MANKLGSLVVSLGLDAAEYTKGLSKSEYQAQQWARRVETSIEAARSGALAAFAAMGTAALVLDRQLESIAGFQGLADKIGDTAEAVASLKLASDISGVSLETFSTASVKLTDALARTEDESKGVGAALQAIGLEMKEFKGLSPVEQIDAVARAFSGFEDGAGKTAVAVQLFGRSGADLIPMLNDLADGAGRQITLTGEQIKAADDYSKATARLRSEVQTLVQVTAADAAPVMSRIVQLLRDTVQYSTSAAGGVNLLELSMRGVKTALEAVLVVGSDVAYVFKTLGDTAGAYAAVSAALIRGDVAGAKAIGEAYREMSEDRRKALNGFQAGVLGAAAGLPQASYSNEGRNYTPRPSQINFKPVTPPRTISGSTPAAIRPDMELDAISAQFDSLYAQFEDRQRAATRIIEQTRTPLERLAATEAELQALRQAGLLDEETLSRARLDAAEKYDAALGNSVEESKKLKSFADEMGLSFTSAFEDAVVGGKRLSDVLKGLEQDLLRIIMRKTITEPLGEFITDGISSFFGGGKAIGGAVSGGTSYLVGERGPELFTPATGGSITPNGAMGVTVNVINQSGQPLGVASQRQSRGADGRQLVELVLSAAGDAISNGSGPMARALESRYGLRPAV